MLSMKGFSMDKDKYLTNLKKAIIEQGYRSRYIKLCLNYAERLLSNNLPVIFDVKHLALLVGETNGGLNSMIFGTEEYYREIHIPKKNGGERILHIPSLRLKQIQRWIVDSILVKMHISKYAKGFCKGGSIVKNAIPHLNKECIINLDLKDFFPSVSFKRVFRVFNYYGYTKEVSFALSRLCTLDNELPQGSPASPWLSNIVCLKLDKRLSSVATKYEAAYTRYADDITFSGSKYIQKLKTIAVGIISDEGFKVNDEKTRVKRRNERQEVTGLIVNNCAVKVSRKYKRSLWQEIYYCKKFGVSDHMSHTGCYFAFYKEHLYGKAYFINMVEPEEGKKLFEALDKIDWGY